MQAPTSGVPPCPQKKRKRAKEGSACYSLCGDILACREERGRIWGTSLEKENSQEPIQTRPPARTLCRRATVLCYARYSGCIDSLQRRAALSLAELLQQEAAHLLAHSHSAGCRPAPLAHQKNPLTTPQTAAGLAYRILARQPIPCTFATSFLLHRSARS